MIKVQGPDGRAFEFPETLTGTARLIGPQGGTYDFDAELLREFLIKWAKISATAQDSAPDDDDES